MTTLPGTLPGDDPGSPKYNVGSTGGGNGYFGGGGSGSSAGGGGGFSGFFGSPGGFGLTPVSRRVTGGVQHALGTSALGGTAWSQPQASSSSNPFQALASGANLSTTPMATTQSFDPTGATTTPNLVGLGSGTQTSSAGSVGTPTGTTSSAQPAMSYQDYLRQAGYTSEPGGFIGTVLRNGYQHFLTQYASRPSAGAEGILSDYQKSGAFSPDGNPALMAAVQTQALQNAQALRQHAYNAAQLYGGDPSQQAYAAIQGDLNSQGGVADALNNARLSTLMNQQQFGQSLYQQMQNYYNQLGLMNQNATNQQNYANANSPGFLDYLGGIIGGGAGNAVGNYLGGLFK